FRDYLVELGFRTQVSPGGWILRRTGPAVFGHATVAMFPEVVSSGQDYSLERPLTPPSHGLHTICSTLHQTGIASFFCAARIGADDPSALQWHAIQLGLPAEQPYQPLVAALTPFEFIVRTRRYNFLRYHTDTTPIPDVAVPEEFSKEHLR